MITSWRTLRWKRWLTAWKRRRIPLRPTAWHMGARYTSWDNAWGRYALQHAVFAYERYPPPAVHPVTGAQDAPQPLRTHPAPRGGGDTSQPLPGASGAAGRM